MTSEKCHICGRDLGKSAKTKTVKDKGRVHKSCFEREKEKMA